MQLVRLAGAPCPVRREEPWHPVAPTPLNPALIVPNTLLHPNTWCYYQQLPDRSAGDVTHC